jgi:hypothetical protein
MTNDFAERRRQIIAFLNGLTQPEKLLVLACLTNDAAIRARIPDLAENPAKTVLDMRRAHYRAEVLALAETGRSNVDLRLLARRKGCRLEAAEGSADLWRIVYAGNPRPSHSSRPIERALTRRQALEVLRCIPDQR